MRLLVVGAGGHAKVVIDAATASGWQIAGVVDPHTDRTDILGYPISRDAEKIEADAFIVAIGDNSVRQRHFDEYRAAGFQPATVVHPSAIVSATGEIGASSFIGAGAVVGVEAVVGENVILNTACVVDHDCRIGDHAHIGPTASLCGEVAVGQGVLLGVGTKAIPGVSVGAWSVCGAGTVVIDDLSEGMVYVGAPARAIRRIGTAE